MGRNELETPYGKEGREWAWIAAASLPGTAACLATFLGHPFYFPAMFLFYPPLCLCAVTLGFTATAALTAVLAVLSTVGMFSLGSPAWMPAVYGLGLAVNLTYWRRWIRARETVEFQVRKKRDDLELDLNESRIDLEKYRTIHQANLFKVQRYTALNELARNLAMIYRTQEVISLLIETISKTFMVSGGVYTLLLFESGIGPAGHAVRFSVDTSLDIRLSRERFDGAETYNAWVVSQGKPLFSGDTAEDFRFQKETADSRVRSLVAAPLIAGTEVLGLVRLESCVPEAFRQEDARLLSNFCDLGTVALEDAALYSQTIELAITDGLTGLYVQRYYKERVRDEVFRAVEHKLSLSLMMIDVDDFKKYNDQYGHLVGDRVLKVVADHLKESVRTVDLVSRYGGEEFSILLVKTPLEGARTVAERIRQELADEEIMVSQRPTGITVSIGVAEWNGSLRDVDAFIELADRALYKAKAEGKNRVRTAGSGDADG